LQRECLWSLDHPELVISIGFVLPLVLRNELGSGVLRVIVIPCCKVPLWRIQ